LENLTALIVKTQEDKLLCTFLYFEMSRALAHEINGKPKLSTSYRKWLLNYKFGVILNKIGLDNN